MAPGQYGVLPLQPEIPPKWDRDVGRNLPNNAEGYGRVDLEASLFPSAGWGRSTSRSTYVRDETTGIGQGPGHSLSYTGVLSSDPLIVTLVWTDPYGLAGAGTKLVNDLDLEVTSAGCVTPRTGSTTVPTPADFVRDDRNNAEQVSDQPHGGD
jgi:hypothetical protein